MTILFYDFSNADFYYCELFDCMNDKLRTPNQKWIVKRSKKSGPILKWVPKSV